MNQVGNNRQLLDIAEDFFRFVTKFFEIVKASAAHIYHSALELCPMSSIIRKLYYHRRITCSPKVVIGTPDSWDSTIAISGEDCYRRSSIWSPCGRFVAAHTGKAVEIRNQLTLELITILQPTETIYLTGPLAYSPDGRSIACTSDTAIIIWDIQTGGVAEEIECSTKCNISLVWSPDAQMLCTINWDYVENSIVYTHDISSRTTLSLDTLKSEDTPYLWTDENSFWVMTRDNVDRKSTRLNSSHPSISRMPSSA